MIIYPFLPSGHTIFCDDIRHEIGGKISLIGIYQSEIIVREFPITLPKLCMIITINEKISSDGQRRVKVFFEPDDPLDKNETVLLDVDYNVPEDAIKEEPEEFIMRTNRIELVAAPFKLERSGKIKVRMHQDEDEIRIGTILIKLDQMPIDTENTN